MYIQRISAVNSIKKNTKTNIVLSAPAMDFSKSNRADILYLNNNTQNKNISFGSLFDFLFSDKNTQTVKSVVEPPIDDNKPKERYPQIKIQKGLDLYYSNDGIRAYPEFKVKDGDLSEGNLEKCYMKESEFINSNLSNVSAPKVQLHYSKLINSNLSGLYAPESIFKFSEFTDSNLTNAKVQRSNFQNATFKNADLTRCDLSQCNLMGADLEEAQNIDTASLVGAVYNSKTKFPLRFDPVAAGMYKFEAGEDVGGMYLAYKTVLKGECSGNGDDFSGMNFAPISKWLPPTEFNKCSFYGVIFDKCNFENVDAQEANFANCSLYGAKFIDSDLTGANFTGAMFDENTKFEGDVNLQNAVFLGVDLRNSGIEKLSNSELYQNPLQGALYTVHTKFPKGFDPKKEGMILLPFKIKGSELFSNIPTDSLLKRLGSLFPYNLFRNNASQELEIIDLVNSPFRRADFADSDLSGLCMKNSNFEEAYFRDTNMKNTDCENSNFRKAKLIGTNLSGANMKNTDLTYTKMQGAKINDKTDFRGAKYNDFTVFPFDFDEKIKQKMVYVPIQEKKNED